MEYQLANIVRQVGGISHPEILRRVLDLFQSTIDQGETDRFFRRSLDELLNASGHPAMLRCRTESMFQTLFAYQTSQQRLAQSCDPAVVIALPYWKFMTAGDGSVKASHAALDGFVARWDDPVWKRIYPPLGINCRCAVFSILESEAPGGSEIPGEQRLPKLARSLPNFRLNHIP